MGLVKGTEVKFLKSLCHPSRDSALLLKAFLRTKVNCASGQSDGFVEWHTQKRACLLTEQCVHISDEHTRAYIVFCVSVCLSV